MLSRIRQVALFAFLFTSFATAQVITGNYPFGTFDNKGVDTINLGNLNIHLAIPVIQKAGRGLPFFYTLVYDSSVWQIAGSGGSSYWEPVQNFGWLGQTVITTGYLSYSTSTHQCDWPPPKRGSYYIYYNWVYHDPFGVSHSLGNIGNAYMEYDPTGCDSTVTGFTAQATDGSGISLTTNSTNGRPTAGQNVITTPSGVKTTPPLNPAATGSTITDRNGNQISVSSAGVYTDTTGVAEMTVAGQAPNNVTLTYPTPTGNAAYTIKYQSYTVQTDFGCSSVGEYSATSVSLVSEIDLPDSSKYTFSYEQTPNNPSAVTGRLASVTLPTGGTITYTYTGGSHGIVCSDGSTAGLTRTLTNDPAGSTWTYSRVPSANTSETDVTDGLGNHSVYNFVLAGQQAEYYETNRAIYEGAASGTPLLSRQTCYNGSSSPCTTTSITLPFTQVDTYETLNGVQMHGATVKYNSYGLQTEEDTFDYGGASSRGPLLQKEVWSYAPAIPSELTEDYLYDGSGNMAGFTEYAYDTTTPITSSGVPQHVSVSGPRGNLGIIYQAYDSGTGDELKTTATYEDTGSVLTTTTPNGTSTFSYDGTFTYQTGVSLPTPSSGVSLSDASSYDSTNSGVLQSSTDPNGAVTSIPSYDALLRPLEVDYPASGKTTYTYTPTQTGTHQYQTASVYSDKEVQVDGWGRVSRAAIANGQGTNPWYQQDECYDANGNAQFTSYIYQGQGFSGGKVCSGSGDTASYDALGRVTKITRGNGETITYTYNGRATEVTDQNGVSRIVQVDGLGRPTIVCEISSNGSMPGSGSPASCGTDITGTGFTTNYSYALATGTTTVTQGAQTRTFQTDWLGRTISVTEPESGTTTYSYAYNSTGLVVTRKRPRANQTNPSTLTTTTTQYDSLGRVVSISYDDGTPTKNFAYDASAGAGWSDLSQAYLKGRLSLASVSNAGTAFSYDAMGRVTYLDECLPSGCGNTSYNRQMHYTYDLAGDLLTSTDGGGVTSTYTVSTADELQSLTSSLNNSSNPPNLISSVQNGPNGPVSWNLGNGLKGSYTYDVLGRMDGGGITLNGNSVYGFSDGWSGSQLKSSTDSALGQTATYSYDEFNRLASRTITSGTTQNFSYVYDRYGNRWQQNLTSGTGPAPQFNFNTSTNQVTNSGYAYDAAGDVTNDSFHSYTFDADGNVTAVDGGTTASYVYNALNQRVQVIAGGTTTEYVFNLNGQRVSEWNGTTHAQLKGKYYWGMLPVAYYNPGGAVYFEHQDWLGTERMRTSYNGGVEATFTSLPFGDSQSATGGDAYHFAALDHDAESGTDHAQFRQYSNVAGRWFSPDLYVQSYNRANPQSFNRYSYVDDGPLSNIDMIGLDSGYVYNPYSGCFDYWVDSADGGHLYGCEGDSGLLGLDGYGFNGPDFSGLPAGPAGVPFGGGSIGNQNGTSHRNVFTCAADAAEKSSLAGMAQHFGIGTSPVGGFVTDALGGNAFSGLTDLIQSFGSGEGGGHSVFYNMGEGAVAGPTLGFGSARGIVTGTALEEGTPWTSGPADVATGALVGGAYNGVTGAGDSLQTVFGSASLSSATMDAASFATGVGELKLAYDAGNWLAALGECATGFVH